jgi:hypothetical protein
MLVLGGSALGQMSHAANWDGVWNAEGTLFTIAVTVRNQELIVSEVESLGFIWTSSGGIVEGNKAYINVQYAGATGRVEVQLLDDNTGVAFLLSCLPEFMVVCALAKDRQARFIRVMTTQ